MSTTPDATPLAAAAAATPAQPKKARPNPARRKASQANKAQQSQRTTTPPAAAPTSPTQNTPKKAPRKLKRTSTSSTSSTDSAPKDVQTVVKYNPQQVQVQSQSQSDTSKMLVHTGQALVTGGLVGCVAGAAIMLGVSLWYSFAGVEPAILVAKSAKLCVDNLADEIIASLKTGTYSAQEALDVLRRTTLAYASTIPGGAPLVERTFREIDTVRTQRGPEVHAVLQGAFDELSAAAGKKGKSAAEMQGLVRKHLGKLCWIMATTAQDMVARNPTLKPLGDGATKYLTGVAPPKTPTVKVNMQVKVR